MLVQFLATERYSRSNRLKPVRVERLRHQSSASYVQEFAGRKKNVSFYLGGNQLAFATVERTYIDTVSLRIGLSAPLDEVEEMFVIGQEEGPAMSLNAALAQYLRDR